MQSLSRTLAFLALLPVVGCAPQPNDPPAQVLEVTQIPEQWWHDSIVYQIWPRSFRDADGDGNGDFAGITERLDYLTDLGVDVIWFTPIFEAPSYHGYDFVSFTELEADYGTMADFEALLAAAHQRGIRIVLDLVINHISDRHPWFIQSAAEHPDFHDFFLWADQPPADWGRAWESTPNPEAVWHWHPERQQFYYGAFGPSQPDVNLRNPAVVKAMFDMARFWLDKGVDGFRLDAVRYAVETTTPGAVAQADTPETIQFWADFTQFVKSVNPDAMLVAEAWADMPTVGRYYDNAKGLDSAFDFDFGYVVIELLADGQRTADFGSVAAQAAPIDTPRDALWQNLLNRQAHAPLAFYAPFLTNHDQIRILHALGQDRAKARVAANLLLTSPGTVYIYYGEEIGMSQVHTGNDTYKRALMQWDPSPSAGFSSSTNPWLNDPRWSADVPALQPWWNAFWDSVRTQPNASVAQQVKDPTSLLNHYKALIAIRRKLPALALPTKIEFFPVDHPDAWVLRYHHPHGNAIVLINLNPAQPTTFTTPQSIQGHHNDLTRNAPLHLSNSTTLPPAGITILSSH